METTATRLIRRPDGSEALVLQPSRIVVERGPDKGQDCLVDRPVFHIGTGSDCDLQLSDEAVSRMHLELRATDQGLRVRDLGSTNGTRIGGVRIVEAIVTGHVSLEVGETVLGVHPTSDTVEIPLSARGGFGGLLGQSRPIRQVFALLERVAPTRSTILIEGESGTGKEIAAAAIHQASERREAPFVVLDCGAIPFTLIESELFGHEKGAFTGAHEARVGALEEADGGTLFLDEIGELPLTLQPRLLRFLERQEVKRVGATHHRNVDVRVVAATNRRLAAEVKEGRFRQDLFYRLAVVRVELPPLRERPDDILLLAHHFAATLAPDPRTVITPEIAGLLTAYDWPGNVRELRNVVERVALLPELGAAALREEAPESRPPSIGTLTRLPFHEGRKRWQDIFERQYLVAQMAADGGVVKRAAARADLPRQTFHRLLRKHGLKEP